MTWDNLLLLSDAQDLSSLTVSGGGVAAEGLSDNYFDTRMNDVFRSPGMAIRFRVATAFATSTTAALAITAFYDSAYSTTPAIRAVVGQFSMTSAEVTSRLVAGQEFFLPIAPATEVVGVTAAAANRALGLGNMPKGRIFALQYTVSGPASAKFTAGAITAGVVSHIPINSMALSGVHPTYPAVVAAGLGAPGWGGVINP